MQSTYAEVRSVLVNGGYSGRNLQLNLQANVQVAKQKRRIN